jgi:hypothetical protein
MRDDMHMLDLPVRHNNAVFVVSNLIAATHAVDLILCNRAIIRMDALQGSAKRRLDRPLKAQNLVSFVGPENLTGTGV